MSHTPGPLRAVRAIDGRGDFAVINAANDIVAECFEDIRLHGERASDEAKANATLFAAAPDLLAALIALRNGCREPTQVGVLRGLEMARAAIAKATP